MAAAGSSPSRRTVRAALQTPRVVGEQALERVALRQPRALAQASCAPQRSMRARSRACRNGSTSAPSSRSTPRASSATVRHAGGAAALAHRRAACRSGATMWRNRARAQHAGSRQVAAHGGCHAHGCRSRGGEGRERGGAAMATPLRKARGDSASVAAAVALCAAAAAGRGAICSGGGRSVDRLHTFTAHRIVACSCFPRSCASCARRDKGGGTAGRAGERRSRTQLTLRPAVGGAARAPRQCQSVRGADAHDKCAPRRLPRTDAWRAALPKKCAHSGVSKLHRLARIRRARAPAAWSRRAASAQRRRRRHAWPMRGAVGAAALRAAQPAAGARARCVRASRCRAPGPHKRTDHQGVAPQHPASSPPDSASRTRRVLLWARTIVASFSGTSCKRSTSSLRRPRPARAAAAAVCSDAARAPPTVAR